MNRWCKRPTTIAWLLPGCGTKLLAAEHDEELVRLHMVTCIPYDLRWSGNRNLLAALPLRVSHRSSSLFANFSFNYWTRDVSRPDASCVSDITRTIVGDVLWWRRLPLERVPVAQEGNHGETLTNTMDDHFAAGNQGRSPNLMSSPMFRHIPKEHQISPRCTWEYHFVWLLAA